MFSILRIRQVQISMELLIPYSGHRRKLLKLITMKQLCVVETKIKLQILNF